MTQVIMALSIRHQMLVTLAMTPCVTSSIPSWVSHMTKFELGNTCEICGKRKGGPKAPDHSGCAKIRSELHVGKGKWPTEKARLAKGKRVQKNFADGIYKPEVGLD
jgi:hypothetical protein